MTLLIDAKATFKALLQANRKALCPCCETERRINRYRISGTLARALLWMYRNAYRYPSDRYVEWRKEVQRGNLPLDLGKLARWGLIESTGKGHLRYPSAGHWRLTERGVKFATAQITIPRYVFDYYGQLWHDESDEQVSIKDCLPAEFDFYELLGRARATEAEQVVLDGIFERKDNAK